MTADKICARSFLCQASKYLKSKTFDLADFVQQVPFRYTRPPPTRATAVDDFARDPPRADLFDSPKVRPVSIVYGFFSVCFNSHVFNLLRILPRSHRYTLRKQIASASKDTLFRNCCQYVRAANALRRSSAAIFFAQNRQHRQNQRPPWTFEQCAPDFGGCQPPILPNNSANRQSSAAQRDQRRSPRACRRSNQARVYAAQFSASAFICYLQKPHAVAARHQAATAASREPNLANGTTTGRTPPVSGPPVRLNLNDCTKPASPCPCNAHRL